MPRLLRTGIVALLLALVAACGDPTATAEPSATLGPTPTPLAVADIFSNVSPFVAFIETPIKTGSVMLYLLSEETYVITNAHVIWPFEQTRRISLNGSEHLNVPVVGIDLMGGLAVLGPIKPGIEPSDLAYGEGLTIGSDVFLIGYPAEGEEFPQPTISSGILSRIRQWDSTALTYLQTDAAIAGGQSGGVLVSEQGEVIGISGFRFSEASFGLVPSAEGVLDRAQRLVLGDDVSELGDRHIPLEGGRFSDEFTIRNSWDTRTYVINEPPGATMEVTVDGENNGLFFLLDSFGNHVFAGDDGSIGVDREYTGEESGSATTIIPGPHFLLVTELTKEAGDFQIDSNNRLSLYEDLDDNSAIAIGQTVSASIDHPLDFDFFILEMVEGETVNISVDTTNFDPYSMVAFPGAHDNQIMLDDDSGGGIFGVNPIVTYEAPHTGSYFVVVRDTEKINVRGYFLSVEKAPPGAFAAHIPDPPPTFDSPFGPMALYISPNEQFSIQYPSNRPEHPPSEGVTANFADADTASLLVVEEDLIANGLGELELEQYTDGIISIGHASLPDFKLISRSPTTTSQGLPAILVKFTGLGDVIQGIRFIYMNDYHTAFSATYIVSGTRHEELRPLINYSHDTFRVE